MRTRPRRTSTTCSRNAGDWRRAGPLQWDRRVSGLRGDLAQRPRPPSPPAPPGRSGGPTRRPTAGASPRVTDWSSAQGPASVLHAGPFRARPTARSSRLHDWPTGGDRVAVHPVRHLAHRVVDPVTVRSHAIAVPDANWSRCVRGSSVSAVDTVKAEVRSWSAVTGWTVLDRMYMRRLVDDVVKEYDQLPRLRPSHRWQMLVRRPVRSTTRSPASGRCSPTSTTRASSRSDR